MEGFFNRGKNMDDNIQGNIIDLIIAEEGYPALGYFGGQYKEVAINSES